MTLDAEYPKAQTEGFPELYDIQYGGQHERYTSWNTNLTFLGELYTAAPIKRSGFSFDSEFSNVKVTLAAPVTSGFERFVSDAPLEATTITIYRALESDLSEYVILFSGTVQTVSFRDFTVQATCESNAGLLNFETPRIVYQSYCNHELFDDGCGLNYTDYLVTATLSAVNGAVLESSTFNGFANGYFKVGRAIYGEDERLITKHVNDEITVVVPFSSTLVAGKVIQVLPGCDNSPATCRAFNNFSSGFLGFRYIPSKNPVIWGV